MRSIIGLFAVLLILVTIKCFASQLKQEGATINYCNTKYVSDCYAITRRAGRGEPYKTNLTAVTKYTWGNNVTIKVVVYGGATFELVKTKLCDAEKIDWVIDYIKTYGHVDGCCPYKPGPYGLFNMEFPPKNLPMKISNFVNGNFHAKFFFLVTKTEEIIIESTVMYRMIQ